MARSDNKGAGLKVSMVPAAAPTEPGSYVHPVAKHASKNEYEGLLGSVQPQIERSGGQSGGIPTGGGGQSQSPTAPRGS